MDVLCGMSIKNRNDDFRIVKVGETSWILVQ